MGRAHISKLWASNIENLEERPVGGHGRHDKRSGWRRDGEVGEPEVVEGVQVNVGIWQELAC